MKGYAFISNSTKPTSDQQKSRELVVLNNVNRPCLENALDLGLKVYFGVNRENPEGLDCELPVNLFDSHTYRSLLAWKDNFTAYKNFCAVVKENDINYIHCNTPIGGLIGRLVGKKYNVDKVIYTAHGFHFYRGAPLFNRIVLRLAEKIMARWTDVIITMNEEDYQAALKFKLKKGGKVYKVHGVGITLEDFTYINVDECQIKNELALDSEAIVFISAGDLVPRKNYKLAIQAISKAKCNNLHYLICGEGPEKHKLKKLAEELGVGERVHFLGYRSDIKELMSISDVFLFTTLQEGLPRSMMEAMATGLPCIASDVRGNRDLIDHGVNGYLCSINNPDEFSKAINELYYNNELRSEFGARNKRKIAEYDISTVKREIAEIYAACFDL